MRHFARRPAVGRIALGLAASAVALFIQWLLREASPSSPYAPAALGDWLIRHTPGDLATEAIERWGNGARPAMILATAAVCFAGWSAAALASRWGTAVAVAATTIVAAQVSPIAFLQWDTLVAAVVPAACAALVMVALTNVRAPGQGNTSRRRIFVGGASLAVLGVIGGLASAAVVRADPRRARLVAGRNEISDTTFAETPGLSPRITAPADHYVVDVNLTRPVIRPDDWRLTIDGDVASPRTFTFADIRSMPWEELPILLHCISNPVGGKLISNATWVGFPLADLLRVVEPGPSATLVRIEAADDYDETVLLEDASLVRIAYGMGGDELPRDHGYPVRIIFPGRYGMRSVKWVTHMTVMSEPRAGYWERRGWDDYAVMRTGARIDTPAKGAKLASRVTVAGIAWAGLRGVSRVEVSADGGERWFEAKLEAELNDLSWRRWRIELDLPSGDAELVARATDGTGAVQDQQPRFPHPSGASGYHRVPVTVRAS